MSRTIPERYHWAVNILHVQPNDHILEIGCGYGHMIGLICDRLDSGRITAIDRSEAMIRAARERNEPHLRSRKAEILHQDLLDSILPSASFDKVFLFNLNAFWMDPHDELAEIERLLKPGGAFFIFHQPPPGHELDEFDHAFRSNLTKYGFSVTDNFNEPCESVRSVTLIARPSRQ